MTPIDSEINAIVAGIRRLFHVVQQDAIQASRSFNLTCSQSAALRLLDSLQRFSMAVLYNNGPMSSAELSRKLYVTPSNMTGVVDRLEKKALVSRIRDPGDRRIVKITPTEAGRSLGRLLPDPIEEKLVFRLGHLPPEEIREYSMSIERILGLIDHRETIANTGQDG